MSVNTSWDYHSAVTTLTFPSFTLKRLALITYVFSSPASSRKDLSTDACPPVVTYLNPQKPMKWVQMLHF
jgi:hypothetical protein